MEEKSKKKQTFEEKWSPAIATHGFTSLPNLLIRNYKSLGLTSPELRMIMALESFRWDDSKPWPSVQSLAKMTGITQRRAREILTSLHAKRLIIRDERESTTNTYSFEPLIHKLDQLATSSLPPGRKEPPRWEETRLETRQKSSSEEDVKDYPKKPNMNTGIKSVNQVILEKYIDDS